MLPKFSHKYAIDAKYLGDANTLAWSNLGFWQETSDYTVACSQLADRLASAVQLKKQDRLLDLGCGYGASLHYWRTRYQIQDLSGVELQPQHVKLIQKTLPQIACIRRGSFLNLADLEFKQPFDVVLCIDAAYHSNLSLFLASVQSVLCSGGRLGFHYLVISKSWHQYSPLQRKKYKYLLQVADLKSQNFYDVKSTEEHLRRYNFDQIEIQDLSEAVLNGFAKYIESKETPVIKQLSKFKIHATAKLCRYLYEQGIIRYVQICAIKR